MKNKIPLFFALLVTIVLAGCSHTSISSDYTTGGNSRYGSADARYGDGLMNFHEIQQSDVIGVPAAADITDAQIAQASGTRSFALKPGGRILLVQSGAPLPDGELNEAMSMRFTVLPMNGFIDGDGHKNLDKTLRLIAAKGGADTVVIVWGVMESTKKNNAAEVAVWVPVVGLMVPGETKYLRIRLQALVMDVKSGSWDMVISDPVTNDVSTSIYNRKYDFEIQKLELKQKAYANLAAKLTERFK